MKNVKLGILTFHRANNYGALFQAYALYRILKNYGCDVEFINYLCPAIEEDYQYGLLPKLKRNPKYWLPQIVQNQAKKLLKKKCNQFRDRYLPMSRDYYGDITKTDIYSSYDIIVTGSDQIWNPSLTGGESDWYAFKRIDDYPIVVSYAASAGSLHAFRFYSRFYEENLSMYDMISVREKNLRDYLEKRLNRSISVVLDPTLLLTREDWIELKDKSTCQQKSYIFYYDVEDNNEARKIAEKLAKEKNLLLIHFNRSLISIPKYKYMQSVGPEEFLNLIYNAEMIVTSSFHATVFSVLFEKQFITVPHPRTGDRVKELLEQLGLKDRIIEQYTDEASILCDVKIDYSEIQGKLSDLRTDSVEYLNNCIELATIKKAVQQIPENRYE